MLEGFWPSDLLDEWGTTVTALYVLQARKLGHRAADLNEALAILEKEDQESAYQVLPMIEHSRATARLIAYPPLFDLASSLLRCPQTLLQTSGPNPFLNLPDTRRLLYHWHSEAAYYPKRRNFLNVWFPFLRDKDEKNGTMFYCPGSHEIADRQFIEYQGYDKNSFQKRNHFIQFEIPECELTSYSKVPVIARRGDLVVFHRNLVHSGSVNTTSAPSYAAALRILDFRRDLTMSGNAAAKPYSSDYGRPGISPVTED